MSDQHSFISFDHFHPDPYTQSRTAERILNSAIAMLRFPEATKNIWRSSTSFMPTISREAAKPWKNRFAER